MRGAVYHLRGVEEVLPSVIKKDGRREPFDRLKILNGLKKACEKRPISMEMLERTVEEIEKVLQEKGLEGDSEHDGGRGSDGTAAQA